MSRQTFFNHQQANQGAALLGTNKPAMPISQKHSAAEHRVADPSSTLPKGQCYPIPSFFEYRAKPKEFDSL